MQNTPPHNRILWAKERKDKMLQILDRFTDLGYDDIKERMLYPEELKRMFGEEGRGRTIYLVGPCIVGGIGLPNGDIVANMYKKLNDQGLDYTITRVLIHMDGRSNFDAVLEKDIKNNDIVLFIADTIDREDADIELADIYNSYEGEKWLYADVPIHITDTAVDLIVDGIIEKIIEPMENISDSRYDEKILHKGQKHLTHNENIMIKQYLDGLKQYSRKLYGTAGACIMTCNPFTKGHYHLIEYASRHVDRLYVFVVEEDDFWVPFEDRIEMVRRGTADLNNVVVLPSGNMISRATFVSYFEKEIKQDTVIDAEKDIMIFRDYVASTLGISKRFVGEEPGDNITRQYNQVLKKRVGRCNRRIGNFTQSNRKRE